LEEPQTALATESLWNQLEGVVAAVHCEVEEGVEEEVTWVDGVVSLDEAAPHTL